MNLPDIPEYVAGYFNFIIDFTISPAKACSSYKALNKIDKNLLTYAAIGATLTWLTITLTKKMGTYYHDKSHSFDFIDKLDKDVIPFAVLPFVIVLSLVVHVLVRLIFLLNKENKVISPIHINCKNTINGALAYFAFAPFIIMFSFFITMVIAYNLPTGINGWQILPLIMPTSILGAWAILWCFPASIIAMQPEELRSPYKKAIVACFGLFIITIAAVDWLRSLLTQFQ